MERTRRSALVIVLISSCSHLVRSQPGSCQDKFNSCLFAYQGVFQTNQTAECSLGQTLLRCLAELTCSQNDVTVQGQKRMAEKYVLTRRCNDTETTNTDLEETITDCLILLIECRDKSRENILRDPKNACVYRRDLVNCLLKLPCASDGEDQLSKAQDDVKVTRCQAPSEAFSSLASPCALFLAPAAALVIFS